MVKKKEFLLASAVVSGAMMTAFAAHPASLHAMTSAPQTDSWEVGKAFSAKEVPMKKNMTVLDIGEDDVTGDGTLDQVLLIGHREQADSPFVTDVNVVVKDGKSGGYQVTSVGPGNSGYDPSITHLLDLNQDGVSDMLIAMNDGGSGGTSTYSLLTFADGKGQELVSQAELNQGVPLDIRYEDGFVANITNKMTSKVSKLDLGEKKEEYQDAKIYDANGKRLTPVTGAYDGYGKLAPQWQPDGTWRLVGTQLIWGQYHADRIAVAESEWTVVDGKLQISESRILPYDEDNLPSPLAQPGPLDKIANGQQNRFLLDAKYADVTGDGTRDEISLIGTKENEDSPFITDVQLSIKDGKSGNVITTPTGSGNAGYEPTLYIGHFDKNPTKDILVTMGNGGSGGTSTYSLLTFRDNQVVQLVPQEELNKGLELQVHFADQLQANVTNSANKQMAVLDLMGSKAEYLEMGLYDQAGKLLRPVEGMVDGFGYLQPIDLDEDGVLELRAYQRISGAYHADGLATAVSEWKVQNGKLEAIREAIVPLKK